MVFPAPRQKFVDALCGMVRQSGENVGKPSLRVDVIQLASLDQRVHCRSAPAAGVGTCKRPVLPADGYAAQRTFGGIVGEADSAVVEEAHEGVPTREAVGDGLGDVALGGDAIALLDEPDMKRGDQGLDMFTPDDKAFLLRLAVYGSLELEDRVHALDGFSSDRRFAEVRQIEELPAPMRPAGGLDNRRRLATGGIEVVEACEGVGLHDPNPASHMRARMFARPGSRVFEEGGRRVLSTERPIVADIGPQSPGDGFHLRQNRHGRVVGMDAFGAQHMGADRLDERRQRDRTGANPVGERRGIDLDPLAGEGRALAVERLMQQEL